MRLLGAGSAGRAAEFPRGYPSSAPSGLTRRKTGRHLDHASGGPSASQPVSKNPASRRRFFLRLEPGFRATGPSSVELGGGIRNGGP